MLLGEARLDRANIRVESCNSRWRRLSRNLAGSGRKNQ
jgi:hypothetical protein